MGIFTSKLSGGIFVLLVAMAIAAVAAWFSITGLVALFNASALSVAIMGITLEVGKLVASGILKLNWSNPNYNRALKSYLLVAISTLMLVTAIGIFGFLSAAHLEQAAPRADLQVQSQQLELQVEQRNQENQRLQQRLNQIDQNISVFLQNDQASRGLRASRTLQSERATIQQRLEANNEQINTLQAQLAPIRMQSNAVEAKLGPVKYVAALFGWHDEESAVRLVILVLMVGFDPLAVVLILCGLIMLKEHRDERALKQEEERVFVPSAEPTPEEDEEAEISEEPEQETLPAIEESAGESNALIEALPPQDDDAQEYWFDRIAKMLPAPEASPRSVKETAIIEDASDEDIPEDRSDYERANMGDELARDYPDDETVDDLLDGAEPISQETMDHLLELTKDVKIDRDTDVIEGDIDLSIAPPAEGDEEPIEQIVREMDRDTLIAILERNPGILNEIEEIVEADVERELTDREKLLDLLAKNPAIISDMAEIIASQITKPTDGDSWLK